MYEKQRAAQQDSQQGPTEKQGQIKLSAFQGETGEHSVLLREKLSGSWQKIAMKRKDEANVADQYFRWIWIFLNLEFQINDPYAKVQHLIYKCHILVTKTGKRKMSPPVLMASKQPC